MMDEDPPPTVSADEGRGSESTSRLPGARLNAIARWVRSLTDSVAFRSVQLHGSPDNRSLRSPVWKNPSACANSCRTVRGTTPAPVEQVHLGPGFSSIQPPLTPICAVPHRSSLGCPHLTVIHPRTPSLDSVPIS